MAEEPAFRLHSRFLVRPISVTGYRYKQPAGIYHENIHISAGKHLPDRNDSTISLHFEPIISLTALAANAFLALGDKLAEWSLTACILINRFSSSATSSSPSTSSSPVRLVEVSRRGCFRPCLISPDMSTKLTSSISYSSSLDKPLMGEEGESAESSCASIRLVLESHSLASRASRMRGRPRVSMWFCQLA